MNTTAHAVLAASLLWGGGVGAATEPQPPAVEREIVQLREQTRTTPEHPDAWIALGNALMQQARNSCAHEFGAAEEAYERALALRPDHPEALVGMAWVANSNHDFDRGRDWARRALEVNPHLHHAHALLADRAIEIGDYDRAFEHLQDALDARTDLSTLSRSSHLLWLTGDTRKAKWLMQQAIEAGGPFPENTAWCRAELAVMHLLTGSLLAAEQEAARALAAAPENPRVLVAMGRVRAAQDRHEEAIDLARRSIAVRPTHDALSLLTDLHVLTGREDLAEEQIAEVIAFHGSGHHHSHGDHSHYHADGNAQLAAFLARHDRELPRALAEAEKACETYPNLAALDAHAWCLHLNGRSAEAARVMRRALKWGCADPTFAYHAAVITASLGNTSEARKLLGAALQASPRFDPLLAPRAHAFLESLSP